MISKSNTTQSNKVMNGQKPSRVQKIRDAKRGRLSEDRSGSENGISVASHHSLIHSLPSEMGQAELQTDVAAVSNMSMEIRKA